MHYLAFKIRNGRLFMLRACQNSFQKFYPLWAITGILASSQQNRQLPKLQKEKPMQRPKVPIMALIIATPSQIKYSSFTLTFASPFDNASNKMPHCAPFLRFPTHLQQLCILYLCKGGLKHPFLPFEQYSRRIVLHFSFGKGANV